MGTRYTNTKAIRLQSFGSTKGQKAILAILGVTALSIIIFATKATLSFLDESKPSETTTIAKYGQIDALLEPRYFVEKYMLVNCNEAVLKKIQSIRVTGKISSDERQQDFILTKKLPNLMRLKAIQRRAEITIGFNGQQVWQRLRIQDKEDRLEIITGEEAEPWLAQSHFYDLIISSHLGHGSIESIEETVYESKTYLKATILSSTKKLTEILVDPVTMYPYAEIIQSDDQRHMTIFSDFRMIEGMPTPFHLERFTNGVSDQKTILTATSINIGVLSDYFALPAELEAK